jgi:hypothetical protein
MKYDVGHRYVSRGYSITEFTADLFLFRVGELFEWEQPASRDGAGGARARMHLIEVTRQRLYGGARREPFSLLFLMRGQCALERGLHTLVHPAFERCELLLSRVTVSPSESKGPDGIYYEAVFI